MINNKSHFPQSHRIQHTGQSDSTISTTKTQTTSSISVCDNKCLSKKDKEDLFDLYHKTYSKIGGELFSKEQFLNRVDGYYDSSILQRDGDKKIQNACLCWGSNNPNGNKLCLVFGEESKQAAENRVALVTKSITDPTKNNYIEASGPIANVLLKNKNIPVSISISQNNNGGSHYSSLKTSHGKKITFGNAKEAHQVTPNLREFYVSLYQYNKIKLKLNSNREVSLENIDQNRNALKSLFESVRDSEIPSLYKTILMSKVARKHHDIEDKSSGEHGLSTNMLEDTQRFLQSIEFNDISDMIKTPLTQREREFLAGMLEEKIAKNHPINFSIPLSVQAALDKR